MMTQNPAVIQPTIGRVNNFDLGYRDPLWARLEDKDAEIKRLEALCARAADALSYQQKFIHEHCCDGYPSAGELIAELRKAALA
jgi:hypothetical protein